MIIRIAGPVPAAMTARLQRRVVRATGRFLDACRRRVADVSSDSGDPAMDD